MLGNYFYNNSIRKYIVLLQSLFSNIQVERERGLMPVPITYASKERFIAKMFHMDQNCDQARVETILPRMYLHLVNMNYDSTRKTNVANRRLRRPDGDTDRPTLNSQFNAVPFDFEFEMGIWTRHQNDMFQIVEQILPYFQPSFTCRIKELNESEIVIDQRDIPITIESIQMDEDVEGDPSDRRRIEWILNVRLKGWLYPPTNKEFGEIRTIYLDFNDDPQELVNITGPRETVVNTLDINYRITDQVNNDLELRWEITDSVNQELAVNWDQSEYIDNDVELNWEQRDFTNDELEINYEVE